VAGDAMGQVLVASGSGVGKAGFPESQQTLRRFELLLRAMQQV